MIPKKYLQQTRQINWIFFKLYKEFLQFYEKNMQATKEKWQMTQKEQLELVNKYMRIHTLLSGPLYFASKHTLPKCPTWLLNSLFQVFDQRSPHTHKAFSDYSLENHKYLFTSEPHLFCSIFYQAQ